MANVKKDALSPLMHDDQTDRIVGVKNSDGSEKAFVYTDGSSGAVSITDTTASTSTTTGALRVTGGVGVGGALNVGGGMTVTPNATAPTSNVTIGTSAGIAISGATNNVLIGAGAGDSITGSNGSVAVGQNALGAQVDGATGIENTVAGTLSTTGVQTGVQLVKASGVGEMAVYPIVTLTVAAGGNVTAVDVTTPGSGSTVPSGIVFRTNDARIDPAWRGTLAAVPVNTAMGVSALSSNTTGSFNAAVGGSALQNNTTGNFNSAVGLQALQSNTTGNFNSAVGANALQSNTTANNNSAMGASALRNNTTGTQNSAVGSNALSGNTTGSINCAVGMFALTSNTTGSSNSAVGAYALQNNTTGSSNTAMGLSAGRYRGTGTDTLAVANNSVFIGVQSRAAGDSQTNQVVIGGIDAVGNGSNTTTIGNSSTVGTYIAGTATSLFAIAGDTMRIVGTRTPASNAAGTAGDFAFGTDSGTTYLYYCIASGNWGRVQLTTGY